MNRVPKLRFKEFTDEWEEKRFDELVKKEKKITYGVVKPGEFCDDGIFLIKASDYSKGWNLENLFKISRELDFSYKRSKVGEGDILFTIVGSVGNTAIVPKYLENSNITQQTARLSIDSNFFSNIFIYNFLSTIPNRKQTLNYLKEGVQPSINLSDLEKFKIFIPNLQEQQKIANFLSNVDKKISITEEKLGLFNEYKKGIMQKIFNQELRFKDENGNEYPEWEEFTLGQIGDTYNGLTGKSADDFGKGKKYITYKNIFDNTKIDTSILEFVEVKENEKQNKVEYGDIFFTVSSETPDEVGYTSVLLDKINEDIYLNSFCFGYRLKSKEDFYPEFFRYVLRSFSFREKIYILAQGSTRFNLSKTEVLKIKLNLPCFEEQQKISDFLSAIDTKIEKISDELKNLKEFKKGLLQQMFV